jgi:hypothetical protein
MKFEIKVKCDDDYGGNLSITVSTDHNAGYMTLCPAKARLVGMALMSAADAADTTSGAQAAIDALLASADPGEIVVPAAE